MRIGFLFNHDQIHQVAHSLPIALALARGGFAGEILVITTTPRLSEEVQRLGGPLVGTQIEHVELRLNPDTTRLARFVDSFMPAGKILIYRDNLDFFETLDVLVVAEKTSLILRKVYRLAHPLIVHTRHGAGDRAIGFDKFSASFDHVMCSGPKIRERLIREAGVPAERISIVGYPKFDIAKAATRPRDDADPRPVVLYNPHPSPHLSSWYRHGRAVLDFFLAHPEYRLIFAPHVMLFQRRFVVTVDRLRIDSAGKIAAKYRDAPNIHVDLGSRASTDMTYTQAADVYLGDASSQVYEFLYQPRPCLFLNSHGFKWQGDPNFEHWRAGPVIDSPDQLQQGLKSALETHATKYRAIQQDMRARSFDLTDVPSSQRAAEVLQRLASEQAKLATPVEGLVA